MKSISLKFINEIHEEGYQKNHRKFRTQILNISSIIGVCASAADVYLAITLGDQIRLYAQLTIGVVFLLSSVISYYNYKLLGLSLTACCLILSLVQLTPAESAEAFMYGGCQMVGQCVIFFTVDFSLAVIQLFLVTTIRITLWNFLYVDYQGLVYIINFSIIFVLILCLYKLEYIKRQMYLLTLKDGQEELMYRQTIPIAFALFHYDSESISFKLDSGNQQFEEQHSLTHFLRNSMFQNVSLESHLFQNLSKNDTTTSFFVLFEKTQIQVTISQKYLTNYKFLMAIQPNKKIMSDIAHKKSVGKLRMLFQQFIHKQFLILSFILNKKHKEIIHNSVFTILYTIHIQQLLFLIQNLKQQKQNLQMVNIKNTLEMIIKFLSLKHITIIDSRHSTQINTFRSDLILLLLHIINQFHFFPLEILINQNLENELVLNFNGQLINPDKTLFIYQNENIQLIKSHIVTKNYQRNKNYKMICAVNLSLVFHSQPLINFHQQYFEEQVQEAVQ